MAETTEAVHAAVGPQLSHEGVTVQQYRVKTLDEETTADWGEGNVYTYRTYWRIQRGAAAIDVPGSLVEALLAVERGFHHY